MLERLQNLLIELTGRSDIKITPNTKIKKLGLTSLSVVGLVCMIEDEFDVEIPNTEIVKFKTVKNVVDYLEKNVQ